MGGCKNIVKKTKTSFKAHLQIKRKYVCGMSYPPLTSEAAKKYQFSYHIRGDPDRTLSSKSNTFCINAILCPKKRFYCVMQ